MTWFIAGWVSALAAIWIAKWVREVAGEFLGVVEHGD